MDDVNTWVGIAANYWQVIGGLIVLLIFAHKKWNIGALLVARLSGSSRRIEELDDLWARGTAELENLEIKDARLYALRASGMPRLERCEIGQLASNELPWIKDPQIIAQAMQERPLVNKSHGLAVGEDIRQVGERPIRFVATDYAMVRAARNAGVKPPIISANAIIFCPTTKRVLLHIRSPRVATYPNAIHFIGGNYEPRVGTERFDDTDNDFALRRTAVREIGEETGIQIEEPGNAAFVIVSEEVSSGFVQFTYAGIAVSSTKSKLDVSAEGGALWCSLADLVRFAQSGVLQGHQSGSIGIVPSFALCLLAWLRIGAPDQLGRRPLRKEAQSAYFSMLPHVKKRLAPYKLNTSGD